MRNVPTSGDRGAVVRLVGDDAVTFSEHGRVYLALATIVGLLILLPLWVWASVGGGRVAWAAAATALAVTASLYVRAVTYIRRSGRAASAHVSAGLGYPVRIGCCTRLDGWQRAIRRERYWHDSGRKRPRITWSSRWEDRRWQRDNEAPPR